MDVVAILRTTTNNQTFRKCFLTRPDFLRLAHDVGNDSGDTGSIGDTGSMKIPYSPPQPKSPPTLHGFSGRALSQHDSAYSSSNGLDMFEYLSVDNDSLQTDNRDTEYDNQRREESNRRSFSSTEDILMHINEDVIRSCQKYVDEVQACVSLNQQTQTHAKRRRRPRKLPQIPLSPAATVKSAPLATQSPVNTSSLADELHCADATFQPSPDDDLHYPRIRHGYVPATFNNLGSPEDIDAVEPGASGSSGFTFNEEPSTKEEFSRPVESDDNLFKRRTRLGEKAAVENLEKTENVATANARVYSHYLGDQSSSPKHCDRFVSSSIEAFEAEEPLKRCDSVSVTCSTVNVDDLEVTHRGCHKFTPRHADELFIQIGDPIYVEAEHEDLWCQGINLRSKQRGIFPAVCATDLSFFESQEAGAGPTCTRHYVKYLGSVEVKHHKGTDVLCQAIHKVALSRRSSMKARTLPLCCLELSDYGITMKDRSQLQKDASNKLDSITQRLAKLLSKERGIGEGEKHFFSFKNVSFCGCHPQNDSYFAFITKHPLEMKFACHVFLGEDSTECIADTVGKAFRRYYQQYMAFSHPTEDIYLE